MKKILIGLVVLVSLVGVTASAKAIIKRVEILQSNYVGVVYNNLDEIRVYEMKLASSTCYISINSNTKSVDHNLDCIR